MGSSSLQNVPPQNLEAEQSLLGSVLLENEALFKALEIIKTDDFYRESHRQIYQAMIDLYEKNEPADLITVTEVLKEKISSMRSEGLPISPTCLKKYRPPPILSTMPKLSGKNQYCAVLSTLLQKSSQRRRRLKKTSRIFSIFQKKPSSRFQNTR